MSITRPLPSGERPPRANPEWVVDVGAAIRHVAETMHEFTTDDVWARLAEVSEHTTREHRAMGPCMRAAANKGWIEATYSTVISARRRGAPVRVWRSRIYQVQAKRWHDK
jgi:hypothetical protein